MSVWNGLEHCSLRSDLLIAEVGNDAVVLDSVAGLYYSLNPVATVTWKMLQAGASLSEIHVSLQAQFEVGPDQLRSDLCAFVQALSDRNFVNITGNVADAR